jgi:hypothetical protein
MTTQTAKVIGRPVAWATDSATSEKVFEMDMTRNSALPR